MIKNKQINYLLS